MPVRFFHPRTGEWRTFDQLDFICSDVACSQHPPGRERNNSLVGKVVDGGFEIHFAHKLCTIQFLVGDQNRLRLDGVDVGVVTFVREPECYFSIRTDAETSRRLLEAVAEKR